MMTEREFENFYREHLEEDIIFCLSKRRNIPTEEAMRLYYTSKLAIRIYEGEYGIQYLDYRVLTDLLEKEIASPSLEDPEDPTPSKVAEQTP